MGLFSSSQDAGHTESTSRRVDPRGLSIIAAGTRISGDLETDGVVKIEGRIEGALRAGEQVLVAKGGVVQGDLLTREAIIGGEVYGTIRAEERVEVQPTATINGDIFTQRIVVLEGGRVNGVINMETGSGTQEPVAAAMGSRSEQTLNSL